MMTLTADLGAIRRHGSGTGARSLRPSSGGRAAVPSIHPNASLTGYIASVERVPKLTRENELELSRRYVQTKDQAAREQLIHSNLRYVVAIALKYRRYQVPVIELIAEGNFGLLYALDKFEPERGHRFLTYAAYWIRAYVLNYIIHSWSLVGVGSGALRSKLFFKLRRERVRITNLVGEGDHADEILAKRLNLSQSRLASMMRRLEARDVPLDRKPPYDSASTLLDTLVAAGSDQEELLASIELKTLIADAVRDALFGLDQRERYIIEHRVMADPEDALSLAKLGRSLGISRERARQLEERAKRKLRQRINELSRAGGGWLESARE
jgi:RNA polymerase sigma-32 factor